MLAPVTLDGEREPGLRSGALLLLAGIAVTGAHGALAAGALIGGAAGWTLGRVRPGPGVVGVGLLAVVAGVAGLDVPTTAGTPLERATTWALVAPAGCWCVAAALAASLARARALGGSAVLLLALGLAAAVGGRTHMVSAGAALCVLAGGVLAIAHRAGKVSSPWLLLVGLPLLVGLGREPTAAGPYSHPPELPVRQATTLELLVGDSPMISSLAALPDGRIAYGEFASGRVHLIDPATGHRALLATVRLPEVRGARASYELGLWGLAAHPDGSSIYAMAVHRWDEEDPDPAARSSRIVRIGLDSGAVETVVDGIPAGPIHAGGALRFEPDGAAFFASVGDGLRNGPQGRSPVPPGEHGAILRFLSDGSVPRDNPDPESAVWAFGFRNVYGLALGSDGALWATENGPDCCDALLRVERGRSHGWPPGRDADPVPALWVSGAQRLGPTGIEVLSARYGEYAGDLIFATWHTGALHRVRVREGEIVQHEVLTTVPTARPTEGPYQFAGAFTGLSTAPDGTLWFSTLNAVGRVVALEPQ